MIHILWKPQTSFDHTSFIRINLNRAILKLSFPKQLQCADIKLAFEKTGNFMKANPAAKDDYKMKIQNVKIERN